MKKIILLASILLIAGSVSAQTYLKYLNSDRDNLSSIINQASVAFTAGAAMSNTTGGANFNTTGLAGFNVGFALDLPVGNSISISPEISYAQKGYTANTQFGNFTQRSQYIDIPVLVKFRTNANINLYAGPQLSYFVAANNKFGENFTQAAQENYAISGSSILFQGVIGAGINVSRNVELRARYAVDMQSKYTNGSNVVPSYRNQAVQIGFGFRLN